jgi:hypothetical protein
MDNINDLNSVSEPSNKNIVKTKMDIILESIDNFLLEFNKILIDKETNLPKKYNDGIDEKQIMNDLMKTDEFAMDAQIIKSLVPYGNSLSVKKGKIEGNAILEMLDYIPKDTYLYDDKFINNIKEDYDIIKEYSNNILKMLVSMINNKKLYDEKFIINIENLYNIIKQYDNFIYVCKAQKSGLLCFKTDKIFNELKINREIQKSSLNAIIDCFYKIQGCRNNLYNDFYNILSLLTIIDEKCSYILDYYKKISHNIAVSLTYDPYILAYRHHYKLKDCKKFNECCIEMLSNSFEKLFKSDINIKYIDQINILYQHSIALFDKLTIILSIKD